ncbi:hypothetical protein AcV5_002302 [Taiwanofungus camphoratus]|nr:hypothetical protein AcV5_002302 [Antrodia cinnamomea]
MFCVACCSDNSLWEHGTGQIIWVWAVSLPLTVLNSPAVSRGSNVRFGTAADIVGVILWALGWAIESVADAQKYYYKSTSPQKNMPIAFGLWAWSRHPSYFGEMLCWWGIWLLCLSPSSNGDQSASTKAAQYASVVSPVFTILLLMFASGVPTAEKPQARKFFLLSYPEHAEGSTNDCETAPLAARRPENDAWENYKRYRAQTSLLVPLPPALYRALPRVVKKTILLDWPMYTFKPEQEAGSAGQARTHA